jgi:excisionase family DNA binding protein
MPEHMLSAEQAAEILGLQVRTVRNYVRDGRLPGVRIGKQYRIARADLDVFTSGIGAGGASSGVQVTTEAPAAFGGAPEVASVVQIDGIGPEVWERLERTITAAKAVGQGIERMVRVEPLYDEDRERLRLIIVGGVGATIELLRIVELFSG